MPKLSAVLSTPFSGATEPLEVPLGDDEVLTLQVAPAAVSTIFVLSDSVNHALKDVEDEEKALRAYRGVLEDALSDLVVDSDLEDDETGEIVPFTKKGLSRYSLREVQKLFTLIAGALSEAPFVRAGQAGQSKPGQPQDRQPKKK